MIVTSRRNRAPRVLDVNRQATVLLGGSNLQLHTQDARLPAERIDVWHSTGDRVRSRGAGSVGLLSSPRPASHLATDPRVPRVDAGRVAGGGDRSRLVRPARA